MIDLHTHSIHSDGELIPAELIQRAKAKGYRVIAITDHADESNLETVVSSLRKFALGLPKDPAITVLSGVELTHLYPVQIPRMVKAARRLGAEIVLIHGETIVEPVPRGTNLAGIKAGADIIAHPGLIEMMEVKLAAKNGVFLEITTRRGHSYANGRVAALAREAKAGLVLNTDSHAPGDLTGKEDAIKIAQASGMSRSEISRMFSNSEALVKKILAERKK